MVLFHKSIQVLSLEYQFQLDDACTEDISERSRQKRDIFGDDRLANGDASACFEGNPIDPTLIFDDTKRCELVNCLFEILNDNVPCDYLQVTPAFTCYPIVILPMAPMLTQINVGHFTQRVVPASPLDVQLRPCVGLNSLRSLDISGDAMFVAEFDQFIPDIQGFDQLEELKLNDVPLLNRPCIDMTGIAMFHGLKRLYLGGTKVCIPSDLRLCQMFPNITVLDISNSKLKYLPHHFLDGCKHLQLLNVSANQMTSIPNHLQTALDHLCMTHELSVDFSHNSFRCHCHKDYDDVISMIHWMRQTDVHLVNVDGYQCTGTEEVELLLEKDTDIYNDMCSINEEIIQAVVTTLTVCIFTFLSSVLSRAVYRRRYRIKTFYYKRKLLHSANILSNPTEFDVYVAFDNNDFSIVYELTEILESVYDFKCCIPDRDFRGEGVHVELISHFMSKCQMSIIVLSRQALQNPIHFMERNLARDMELHSFKMKKVIYIFLEDLSDVTDSDVKSIISGNVGLTYSDITEEIKCEFYDKLNRKIYKTLLRKYE